MYLGVSVFIVTLLLFATPTLAEPIHVQISLTAEMDSQRAPATDYLVKLITERSQGRVQLNPKNSSSPEETLKALNAGQLQLAFLDLRTLAQHFSQLQLFELPFLFQDQQHLDRVINGEIGQQILLTVNWERIKPLSIWQTRFRQLMADRSITAAEQLNGMLIKVPTSQILEQYYQLLGATPLPAGQALPNDKATNAWDLNLSDAVQAKQLMYNDLTITNHAVSGSLLVVERNFWSQLPNDLKIIISGAIEDATSYARELSKQQENQNLAELEKRKITIHKLSAEQRKAWQKKLQKSYPILMQGLNQQIIKQVFKG